jgi:hypothetical protein
MQSIQDTRKEPNFFLILTCNVHFSKLITVSKRYSSQLVRKILKILTSKETVNYVTSIE